MDEFVCLTLSGEPGEVVAKFRNRLSAFWTGVLREFPDQYEGVYSEAVAFETEDDRVTRQYMVTPETAEFLCKILPERGIHFHPIDWNDTYHKAEASSNDWFQLDH